MNGRAFAIPGIAISTFYGSRQSIRLPVSMQTRSHTLKRRVNPLAADNRILIAEKYIIIIIFVRHSSSELVRVSCYKQI